MKKTFSLLISSICFVSTAAATTYTDLDIDKIQGEGISDPYNTIHVKNDITNSPCSSTDQIDRFAIVNEVQQSVALAALMAGKKITIDTTGSCNSANIEIVNYIMIYADK
ncbi:hypothetical protein ACJJH9_16895 [Microbulbifer sp. DLAB2-AF]|uniref:hypothetical protein n=1 Tax=Microbulbifer sp. DLAB2-AF TaxID=3243395 RepID=UPI004039961B